MTVDESDRAIARSVLALGRDLGLVTVAEGVESREGWDLLTSLGCDMAQGFVVCPPLTSRQFGEWLDRRQPEEFAYLDPDPGPLDPAPGGPLEIGPAGPGRNRCGSAPVADERDAPTDEAPHDRGGGGGGEGDGPAADDDDGDATDAGDEGDEPRVAAPKTVAEVAATDSPAG